MNNISIVTMVYLVYPSFSLLMIMNRNIHPWSWILSTHIYGLMAFLCFSFDFIIPSWSLLLYNQYNPLFMFMHVFHYNSHTAISFLSPCLFIIWPAVTCIHSQWQCALDFAIYVSFHCICSVYLTLPEGLLSRESIYPVLMSVLEDTEDVGLWEGILQLKLNGQY